MVPAAIRWEEKNRAGMPLPVPAGTLTLRRAGVPARLTASAVIVLDESENQGSGVSLTGCDIGADLVDVQIDRNDVAQGRGQPSRCFMVGSLLAGPL